MFGILSRSIHTATRLDSWDAPGHWRRQHDDPQARGDDGRAGRDGLRRMIEVSRFW